MYVMTSTTHSDHITDLVATMRQSSEAAAQSRADLIASTPILVNAIRQCSSQGVKVERILWALWNDDNPVALADALSSLDHDVTVAVLAMISARAHLGGNVDELLKSIIEQSGSRPPMQPDPAD